ncbi:MAG: hypothetical protein KDB98_12100, partial [Flavobacteriales bacterium]|nr:hypothetical protein [Flavobacteriales bacterium]
MISERTERLLTWALAGGLFLYVLFRAILVPITYDEVTTFFRYINLGHYWPGDGLWDANNHILNSFLSIWSFRVFGVDEVWLRLPNVLASMIYLAAAVGLSSLIANKRLKWLLLLALCCNHFVLEFFAVSRGYGLSMALLLLSILFLYKWSINSGLTELFMALAAIQLATLANLSLLTVNLLIVLWVVGWLLLKTRTKLIPSFLMLAVSGWCVKWFVELSFEYKERGLLYYGSGSGIWDSMLLSLAGQGFPGVESAFPFVAAGIVLVLSVVTVIHILKNGLEERILFAYLFFGALMAVVFMHHFMGVNYPEDRVAMHFLVLAP